jgi:hypothetical protein
MGRRYLPRMRCLRILVTLIDSVGNAGDEFHDMKRTIYCLNTTSDSSV